jgi:phospholipase/carboxylesterase
MELEGISFLYRGPQAPVAEEKVPCIVLLHGYGSNDQDLFSFEKMLPANSAVFSLRAPLILDQGGYAWFSIDFTQPREHWSNTEQAQSSRDQVLRFIAKMGECVGLKLQPPVLVGFSQGSILSLSILLEQPHTVQAVAAFSGYWNRELNASHLPDSCPPVWASHGEQDQVIPIAWPDSTYDQLRKATKVNLEYHRFPWLGHGIDAESFNSFRLWLNNLY